MEEQLIIIVNYINIKGLTSAQAQKTISNVIDIHKDMYDGVLTKNVKIHYVPITIGDSRIECIYPVGNCSSDVESQIIKLYKVILNTSDEQIKEIIQELENKLKLIEIKEKSQE